MLCPKCSDMTMVRIDYGYECQLCGTFVPDERDDDDYAPEPPDDDDPHGVTARNKWADEEYGLDDGTG